ncbi:MAG: hypothetical protein KKC68_04020, partial [Candidatus Thermoplasmatota archaeon]|nr:hypothetical protein [Candidatus Thermoplasmatota archaeon]
NTGSNKDYGHFEDFDPSDVEKLIHVSEIERIRFDQGTPDINGDVEADSPGDLGITTLDTEALETTYDEPLVQYGRYFSNTGDAGNDTGQDLKYGFTRGVWCGDDAGGVERCSDSMNDDELEGMSISYIHAVALNDEDAYSTDYACGGETCDGKFPFTGVLADGGDVWGCHGQVEEYDIDCDDDGFGDSDDVTLPSGFEARDLSDYDQGANVFVMRIKFQDGYPYKLFYGFWNGTKDWDYNEVNDITFKYYLKEPCLLAVAGADEDANATPWMDRATNGSSYIVPLNSAGSGYSSTMTTANSFFGSMMMESNTDTPITIDGWTEAFSGDDLVDFFAAGESDPPFIGPRSGIVGSSLPYACIGKCTEMTCQEDYSASWIDNDCDSGNWIGFDGVCDYDGAPSGNDVVLCNDDSDCTTYGAGSCEDSMLSGDGVGASYSNYNEQLNAAADAAWDRYRLLFADVPESWVYAVDQDTEDDNRNQGTMSRTLFSTLSESGDLNLNGIKNDFDDMEECSSSTRDTDDYCGIRPYIENLEINNSSSTPLYLNHGDQVSLTFDSYADGNQEPIQTIRVIWEDDDTTSAFDQTLRTSYDWEAAATIGHNLTYTYTCDPVNDVSYDDDEGMCKYHVKVQLIDNWDFCSGETQTGTVRGSDCTSFDYYDGEIWVAP